MVYQSARVVDKQAVEEFVKNQNIAQAFEASAKEKNGVEEAFAAVAKLALANLEETDTYIPSSVITPNKIANATPTTSGYCCA